MRCGNVHMRMLVISSFLGIGSGALNVLRLSPQLTQTDKTQFAVRCKFLARQDDCTA
jgi:hypothetical protein